MTIPIEAFADRLNEIMPVILREFTKRLTKELQESKITLPQFIILEFLSREGEPIMTELAHFMNVTTAAMTGIIDRLVRDSLVMRIYDQSDRRIIKVKLTGEGTSLVKKITGRKRQMVIKIFGRIGETERGQYLGILKQIKNILLEI